MYFSNNNIAIIGLGYVGLPLAVAFGSKYKTLGFDINTNRVLELSNGIDRTLESDFEKIKAASQLSFSSNIEDLKEGCKFIESKGYHVEKTYTDLFAIKKFSKTKDCKVILNINPAEPCVDMQTTIFLEIPNLEKINFEQIVSNVYGRLKEVKEYVPYYELIIPPMINEQEVMMLSVKVRGTGDFLPEYAGNLDIINCAAIRMLDIL